jgi:Zn-dependent protease
MDTTLIFTAVIQLLLLLLSISAHEAAHAWLADRCGDPTSRLLGRVSLNPLRHLDPFGSVLLPLLLVIFGPPIFGWGRPPLVMPKNLRRPFWDSLWIAAAGPLANILLMLLALAGIAIAAPALGGGAHQAALVAVLDPITDPSVHLTGFPLMFTLTRLAIINALLALFNLMPLPPLDGGHIALQLLPADWAMKLAAVAPYGRIIGVVLTLVAMPFLLVLFYLVIKVI